MSRRIIEILHETSIVMEMKKKNKPRREKAFLLGHKVIKCHR